MKQDILTYVVDQPETDGPFPESLQSAGIDAIPLITEISQTDLAIEPLERLEEFLKLILQRVMSAPMSGPAARQLAESMKQQGLLLKYKPYAVKAASPLGYSIFLQKEAEGFSFQNHLEHKIEVFHILEVMPGGYVFLCRYEDWQRNYDVDTFTRWLHGESHPFFDRCRFFPDPGDVFVISELGIVHTVIGCLLEEFATASTDMVQRLHDQNDRVAVPDFPRAQTQAKLKRLSLPSSARNVELLSSEIQFEALPTEKLPWGERVVLTDTFVRAAHGQVASGQFVDRERDATRAVLIRVFGGTAHVDIRDDNELSQDGDFSIAASAGELVMIPPGVHFQIQNRAAQALEFSEHRIEPRVAFV